MKHVIWITLVLLVILRNDFWFTNEPTLLNETLPTSLVHQIAISLATAFVWWLAVTFCWPKGLDDLPPDDAAETT